MQKVFRVTVDISKKIPVPAFEVNTNDLKSVKLEITITNGQSLLDLTDVTPRINIRKPDNEVIFQDCEIVDAKSGKVEIILENQAYLVPGTHTAEIACYKGSEITAITGTFSYKSIKGIMNDEAVESKSEFTAIDRKIEEARKLLEDAAENGVGVDEQARQEIQEVTAQLADTVKEVNGVKPTNGKVTIPVPEVDTSRLANKTEVILKSDGVGLNDAKSDLLAAIEGGEGTSFNLLSIPRDNSVTPEKTTFIDVSRSKNKFNPNDSDYASGKIVNADGSFVANTGYNTTGFIPISNGQTLKVSYDVNGVRTGVGGGAKWSAYDSNKNHLPAYYANSTDTFTASSNEIAYVRASVQTARFNLLQIESGTAMTSYEEFYERAKLKDVQLEITKEDIGEKTITETKTTFFDEVKSINLLDVTAMTPNVILTSDGKLSPNTLRITSDFIPFPSDKRDGRISTRFTDSGGNTIRNNLQYREIAGYDENFNFVSGTYSNTASNEITLTNPSVKWIRLGFVNTAFPDGNTKNTNQVMVQYGTSISNDLNAYVEHEKHYEFNSNYLSKRAKRDEINAFLPGELYVAKGRIIEIYNKQVACVGNINNFHFNWKCTTGRSLKRKFQIDATNLSVGNYPLTLEIYDNNYQLVKTIQSTVKVVPNTLSNNVVVNPIGDSLSNGKPHYPEIRTLSGNKISFIGTRWGGDVQGGLYNHEGRSGWTALQYLQQFDYTYDTNGTGRTNPYFDTTNNKFSWSYYKNTTKFNPNAVQLFLGANGMAMNPNGEFGGNIQIDAIVKMVDSIRADDGNIPIFVCFTPYQGDQNAQGLTLIQDGYNGTKGFDFYQRRCVYNIMVTLYEKLKNHSKVYFVPLALENDTENNLATSTIPVNPRSSKTETVQSEIVHPEIAGYMQFADIMFSAYCHAFNA